MKRNYFLSCFILFTLLISCGENEQRPEAVEEQEFEKPLDVGEDEEVAEFQPEAEEPAVDKVLKDPVNADTIEVGVVRKSEEEWRRILTEEEFYILREDGTEPAFRNAYYNNKREGIYYCGACGLPLYSSKTKFDSGTGWPSFYAPIDDKLVKRGIDERFGMVRTEVMCAQCESHLGHIFPYPGVPTEERHCLNSLALDFKEINL